MRLLTLLGLCTLLVCTVGAGSFEEFAGHWTGEGEIIVSWCEQPTLAYDLTIAPDGTVTGRVGDAEIRNGEFSKRSFIMRWLGNGEYIIRADLEGDLVAAERIGRKSMNLFLFPKEEFIEASMNTSGPKTGGKEKMFLTTKDVVLHCAREEMGR